MNLKTWMFRGAAVVVFALIAGQAVGQEPSAKPAQVDGVEFKYAPGKSRLEISFDQEVSFEKVESDPDQVVIEVKNATVNKRFSRKLDTSSFKSNVTLISPYQSDENVRVALQLKEAGDVELSQDGRKIVALIDNKQPADLAVDQAPATDPVAPQAEQTPQAEPEKVAETPAEKPKEDGKKTDGDANLDEYFASQQTKQYRGRKIHLQMRDADIQDVFRVISEASEFNIVLGEEVKGKLTLSLDEVPWDQALDIILNAHKLSAERNGNVLRITTIEAMTKEKEAELMARRAVEAAEPLVVKIFPISYAKIEDIKKIIDDFLSKEVGAGGAATSSKRGSIQIDTRTNSLVIRDTPSTMEKIKRIMKELDTQTPQVLIEAKFVEVQERRQKDIQGRIFATSREFDSAANAFTFRGTQNNFGALFGGTNFGTSTLPNSFAVSPIQGASFGFQPQAGIIPGLGEIAAFLSILEQESTAKVIASPRVVTQNKEQAEITQGQSIQLPTAAGVGAAGTFTTVNAVLRLQVTPQVTNDGNINLKILFSQEAPSAQVVGGSSLTTDTKKVETAVLVDSGATLVIGGIYTSTMNNTEAGIPILRDLPILGPLFGSKTNTMIKGELFIFLTPRLVNEKETGIKG